MVLYTTATFSTRVIGWNLQTAKSQMPARSSHMQRQVATSISSLPSPLQKHPRKPNNPPGTNIPPIKAVNCSYTHIRRGLLLCSTHSPSGFEASDLVSLVDSLYLVVTLFME